MPQHEKYVREAERLVSSSQDAEYLSPEDRLNYATQAQVYATLALATAPREKAPARIHVASLILPSAAKVIHAGETREALKAKLCRTYKVPSEWSGDFDMWAEYNNYQVRWEECEL